MSAITSLDAVTLVAEQGSIVTIPDSFTSIDGYAFFDKRLTSITIPGSVITIGEGAFAGNQLTSVTILDSVISIGAYAFHGNQLTSVTILDGVTSIGDGAFSGNQLTSVTIPHTVTSLSPFAFDPNVIITRIINANPTNITISASTFAENISGGFVVATLSTTDPDVGDTFTYSLVSGDGDTDNDAFSISGNELLINSTPNFEAKSSYSIRIRLKDSGGLEFEKEFALKVSDVDETVRLEKEWVHMLPPNDYLALSWGYPLTAADDGSIYLKQPIIAFNYQINNEYEYKFPLTKIESVRWVPFTGQFRPLTSLTPGGRNRVQSDCRPHGEFYLPRSYVALHGNTSTGNGPG